jgi:hypothetical protein
MTPAGGAVDPDVVVFAVFGLASQALLAAFFAARRWRPGLADRLGRWAYGFGALGLPVGVWLLGSGASYRLFIGPLLLAAWAALGATVDLWRPRPWRGPRIDWSVMGPYVGVYFPAQMFLWWPLWDLARPAWAVFAGLFVVNTALNLRGHAEASRQPR